MDSFVPTMQNNTVIINLLLIFYIIVACKHVQIIVIVLWLSTKKSWISLNNVFEEMNIVLNIVGKSENKYYVKCVVFANAQDFISWFIKC